MRTAAELEYRRQRYALNREAVIRRRRELKASKMTLEELQEYRSDPFREERLGQTSFVVCRECGTRALTLVTHCQKHDKMSRDQYQEKWPFAPIFAPGLLEKMRCIKIAWGAEHEGNYFGGKRHELLPTERWSKQKKPPTLKMERSWKRRGDKRRGKRLPNQRIDDGSVVEQKLAGRGATEIADAAGLTSGNIQARLKRLG